ncbi:MULTISPECIES: hypothetical protein [unclassified Ensifer]|uniref:hypothetical protein n=1 Tax=unclassified Ensifer TaxID=2633371 RepID=UPI001111F89B|nr:MULTISPECIES: hypothetical protein [unclassified Ensifer]
MIYAKDGQIMEKPFASTVPFPSTDRSGLYVRSDDLVNRARLTADVMDRIRTPDAHVRAYLTQLKDMGCYADERRERYQAKVAAQKAAEAEKGAGTAPKPKIPDMLALLPKRKR